jgi:hypothetical protein
MPSSGFRRRQEAPMRRFTPPPPSPAIDKSQFAGIRGNAESSINFYG